MTRRHYSGALLALLLVAGLRHARLIGTDPGIEVADLAALPAPQASTLSQIRPRDVIRISVLGFPELSREFAVPSSGNSIPLIGNVDAAEHARRDYRRNCCSPRGRYVVDPQVILDITEQPGRLFTVGGEVVAWPF